MDYFSFRGLLVVKARACLGLRQCDHNSQLHERDVVISSEEGLLRKTGNVFPESTTAFQNHVLVSARGSVMWEVAWCGLTLASGELSKTL